MSRALFQPWVLDQIDENLVDRVQALRHRAADGGDGDAGGTPQNRDVVLTYAASCIFSPQDTGYTKNTDAGKDMPLNIIQALPKLTEKSAVWRISEA
jgi:hypothetical protein